MNKSYKTVWNETTGTYVAASEVARNKGKTSLSKSALVSALLAIGASMDASAGSVDGGSATGTNSVAVGPSAQATGANAIAEGMGAKAAGGNSIYLGANTDGTGVAAAQDAVAIGTNTKVDANSAGGIALGRLATVTNAVDGMAMGNGSSVSAANSVALGANSVANRVNTVSVGAAGAERQIVNVAAGTSDTDAVNLRQLKSAGLKTDTNGNVSNAFLAYDVMSANTVTLNGLSGTMLTNVAAGAVSASSTDATNGSQLYNVAASNASALGGGSSVNANGSISAPSYVVGGTTVDNVGSALTNLDGR
ncbi:YadA family autotransporter adhesin [Paraburkholderia sp. BL23I1N1]|uniref:YadA family autotransporter adhesin n=1 Tax=Paraburkholderia sp. BL23I1N1 TaxID=1938802 RepID=UPI0016008207|nr:ESPR-type extended signal peptide-containing protein [Paraburkholderia sp. BL23I1N1]